MEMKVKMDDILETQHNYILFGFKRLSTNFLNINNRNFHFL